ncbi:MAG: AMP-binding protein [Promethearchaeota archaeon]
MPTPKSFRVYDKKVWFTEGFWPSGVVKQFSNIEGLKLQPLFQLFTDQATLNDFWDKDICIFVLGDYIERVTFRTLIKNAKRFGTFLSNIGIKKGDVVAIDIPNSINFIVAYLGTQYIGAIAAPVNPNYRPNEALHEFQMIKPKTLVLMDFIYFSGISLILNKTKIKHVIHSYLLDFITAEGKTLEKLQTLVPNFQSKIPATEDQYVTYNMKEMIDRTKAEEINVKYDIWKDPAVYLMTGGTTGLPKVAMLSHANLISDLYMVKEWTRLKTGMISIGTIPFFHSYGMTGVMNASLTLGMQMLLFPKIPREKDLCSVINQLKAPEGIVYVGVEALFKRLTDFVKETGFDQFREKYDIWEKLIYAIQGAGPLNEQIRLNFEQIFCPIRVGYGLTETSPVVSIDPFWGLYKKGKIGLPLPGTDWAIFDSENFKKGPICNGTKRMGNFGKKHIGEICISGPQVMLGYLNAEENQEKNIQIFQKKRWILTGDIGYMDKHGFCKIIDRKKSLIKVSGNSVFPKEVEKILREHELVEQVVVGGLPNGTTGEAVKAWVLLRKGSVLTSFLDTVKGKKFDPQILKNYCKEKLAVYKCPQYIEIVRKFPTTLTGTILKDELIEEDRAKLRKGKKIKG